MASSPTTIVGAALPRIPWEDKPKGYPYPMWRYSGNPIIRRDQIPVANSIFNSAVVPFGDGFAGVFRIDYRNRTCRLHTGWSKDGINWQLEEQSIRFVDEIQELPFEYGYDPRVVWLEDRYYVTWCNGLRWEPTIGCAWTKDFRTYHAMENLTLPYNRNGVLFPRKINGKCAMLTRPSDPGHTPFGNIYYSQSPDLKYWGDHRFVMGPGGGWQRSKIGAGPSPIETKEGWLLFYHGVITMCNGMTYSFGAALLDLEKPWQVRYRIDPYLIAPREPYECAGDVANVCFPVGMLADSATGKIAVYYGAADTVIAMAFTQVDELIEYIKNNAVANPAGK